jgi:hypothetical protein
MACLSKIISNSALRREAPGLLAEIADLGRTFNTLFDPYQPELHYMRGPGPKWHAKHDSALASTVFSSFAPSSAKA